NRYKIPEDYKIEGWRELQLQLPYKVYWTFNKFPSLICNNIFINDATHSGGRPIYGSTGHANSIAYPSIAIMDPNGLFPLNLQRDRLQVNEYPFNHSLIEEVFVEAVAWLFFNGPTKPIDTIKGVL